MSTIELQSVHPIPESGDVTVALRIDGVLRNVILREGAAREVPAKVRQTYEQALVNADATIAAAHAEYTERITSITDTRNTKIEGATAVRASAIDAFAAVASDLATLQIADDAEKEIARLKVEADARANDLAALQDEKARADAALSKAQSTNEDA